MNDTMLHVPPYSTAIRAEETIAALTTSPPEPSAKDMVNRFRVICQRGNIRLTSEQLAAVRAFAQLMVDGELS